MNGDMTQYRLEMKIFFSGTSKDAFCHVSFISSLMSFFRWLPNKVFIAIMVW